MNQTGAHQYRHVFIHILSGVLEHSMLSQMRHHATGHAILISGLTAMCLTSRWVFAHLKQAWLSLDALDRVSRPDGEALV